MEAFSVTPKTVTKRVFGCHVSRRVPRRATMAPKLWGRKQEVFAALNSVTKKMFGRHVSRRILRRATMAPELWGRKRRMFLAAPKIFGQREWSSRHRRGIAASFVSPKTSERLK